MKWNDWVREYMDFFDALAVQVQEQRIVGRHERGDGVLGSYMYKHGRHERRG